MYSTELHGTTILSVRRNGVVADRRRRPGLARQHRHEGQRPQGAPAVRRQGARRLRRRHGRRFTLFERFEAKLQQYGNLTRAAIELAKDWRTDRSLRRLEALLCVADAKSSFIISGNGDVIEPEDDIMAIGSGGAFAQAAARALAQNTDLDARTIVEKALNIAADICIYTNRNLTIEELRSCGLQAVGCSQQQTRIRSGYSLQPPAYVLNDPPRNRPGARQAHRRAGRRQARRRDCAAQSLAPHAGAESLRAEITPKNILMIGPTGVGKTEIARRLARLARAPFIKVEATKFTEVGYVGREVDSIIKDLMDVAVKDDARRGNGKSAPSRDGRGRRARARRAAAAAEVARASRREPEPQPRDARDAAEIPQDAARRPARRARDRDRSARAADGRRDHGARRHGRSDAAAAEHVLEPRRHSHARPARSRCAKRSSCSPTKKRRR